MLIGSQSINSLALRTSFTNFSRETDAKLERLREVVRRIQNGEDVDVEGMLGTGDPKKEREWEDGMQHLAFSPNFLNAFAQLYESLSPRTQSLGQNADVVGKIQRRTRASSSRIMTLPVIDNQELSSFA